MLSKARALALFLALAGCDKLRSFTGLAPARATAEAAPPPVAIGPWLLDPRQGQMTVAWATLEPSVGRVWYGTKEPDRLAMEEGATTTHRVVLAPLQPATQYRYRVEGGNEVAWFTSAPAEGAEGPVRLVVFGDNEGNGGDHALVARAAAAARPQLVLHAGDMVATARDEALWRVWFDEERDLLAHAPILAAAGDREIGDQAAAYARWFQRRGMPAYSSLDYGPIHVAVLDSWELAAGATPQRGRFSEAQKAWLEEDLRRVPEDRHVFVLVHQGPFAHPQEEREGHGPSEDVRAAITSANRVHPVEAVFSGHEHFYERGDINGIRYLVLGGGGAPLGAPDEHGPGMQASAAALSFASVAVCGCHTTATVKDVAGKVIDSIALADCPTACSAPAAPEVAVASPAAATQAAEEAPRKKKKGSRRRRREALDGRTSAAENRDR